MTAAALIAASLAWLPSDGSDMPEREVIAAAIVHVTHDPFERAMLMVIAAAESSFQSRYRVCRTTGDQGRSVGVWQTSWRSRRERTAICTDLVAAARRALSLVHASEHMCRHQPARHRGAAYASGSCTSRVGRAIAERRYVRAAEVVITSQEAS